MLSTVVLPWLHYLTVMMMAGGAVAELYLLRLAPTPATLTLLPRVDRFYGITAALVLVTGILRMVYGGKGPDWFRVAELGRTLDPTNSLYQPGAAATAAGVGAAGAAVVVAVLRIALMLPPIAEAHIALWGAEAAGTACPINYQLGADHVAELLRPVFFERHRPCIFTSATLGVGERDLGYFRKRVGAGEVEALRIGSPFDYERQMKVHLVRSMPDPKEKDYETALAQWIRHVVAE